VNIVKAGVEWLAKLSNPVGWVVGAIQVIYDVLSFFVNRINQILGLVNAVVSSIKQIAEGSIGAAANWIEEAMDRTLPTIIAFLADLVGISDPAPSVRDIVKSIREKVDKALDWLVDKAKAIGQRILGALGLGGREEKKPAAAEPDVPAVTFTAAGESHRLWTELEGGRPVLMIASNGAPFDTFMADLEERVKNLSDEQKKTELQSKIPQARQIANETKIDFAKVAELLRADKPNEAGPKKEEVSDDEQRLANLLQSILENLPKKETGEVDKAKDAFKTRLFSRRELEEILEISKTMANERTNLWMQQGILYKLSSSAFDPLTLYSFDQDKAGQREVNPNNRRKYGYINPAKDSDIGLQILSKGLRTDSPQPILKDDAAYHRTQAKYDSQRPGSRYQNFGYVVAILGHKDPGASGHWNRTGHTQSKNDNTQWNRDPANYQGPEHEIESAASGPEAERYRVPSKEIGSHPEWL